MLKTSLVALGSIALSQVASAGQIAADSVCGEPLKALVAEWDAIAYPEPMKPSQAFVYGRLGHVNSGPEVTYMRGQIRAAVAACQDPNEAAAAQHIAAVRALLDRPKRSED